ncbi:MAG: GNAT family N-acetyltransferase [Lachnospiraceae bacterium]|nr:GNAT family N-acetyltransferase [Lachnospiraceae bacterium]
MITFEEKKIELVSNDGDRTVFLMRPFRSGDEAGMIGCVTEEYGSSYFKKDFYDEDRIREDAVSGKYVFFVAEADGEIAGMEIFHIFKDGEDYIEPASQIIRKKYRKYGLSGALVNYTLPLAEKMGPCALFVHAVTFHRSTQNVCEAYGMIPTGFRLGSFLTEKMHNSYEKYDCDKYSEGIMVLPVAKKKAGTVYVPKELESYTDKIYKRLKVDYNISGRSPDTVGGAGIPERSEIVISRDNEQRFAAARVLTPGRDIALKMKELIASFPDEPGWVIQVMLNMSSPSVFYEYDELKKAGFFFSGLKPVCGPDESMYMQWIGDTKLNMEGYALTESFDEIRRDIEAFM